MTTLEFQEVNKEDLNTQVYNIVLDWLMNYQIKPGKKLTLKGVANQLGTSRTPVHHALTRLVSENLLEVKCNQGFYVVPLTPKTIYDAYSVRMALELLAAEKSIGKITEQQLAELHRLMVETNSCLEGDKILDKKKYLDLNRKFHKYQVSLAGNELLDSYYAKLKVNLLMGRILYQKESGVSKIAECHVEIVNAYESGDLQTAQKAIRAHTDEGIKVSLEEISKSGGTI